MSRIVPVEQKRMSWWMRALGWMARRSLGKVPEPLRVMAHHPRVLVANVLLEGAMGGCRTLPPRVRHLAELRAATLVGCPF